MRAFTALAVGALLLAIGSWPAQSAAISAGTAAALRGGDCQYLRQCTVLHYRLQNDLGTTGCKLYVPDQAAEVYSTSFVPGHPDPGGPDCYIRYNCYDCHSECAGQPGPWAVDSAATGPGYPPPGQPNCDAVPEDCRGHYVCHWGEGSQVSR